MDVCFDVKLCIIEPNKSADITPLDLKVFNNLNDNARSFGFTIQYSSSFGNNLIRSWVDVSVQKEETVVAAEGPSFSKKYLNEMFAGTTRNHHKLRVIPSHIYEACVLLVRLTSVEENEQDVSLDVEIQSHVTYSKDVTFGKDGSQTYRKNWGDYIDFLHWKATFVSQENYSSFSPWQEFVMSLPGIVQNVTFIPSSLLVNYTIHAFWVNDAYSKQRSTKGPPECKGVNETTYSYCFNYTIIGSGRSYLFFRKPETKQNFLLTYVPEKDQSNKSWWGASKVCRYVNGSLPVIKNKEDLKEVIELFLLTQISPVQGLYIGVLRKPPSNTHEVCT